MKFKNSTKSNKNLDSLLDKAVKYSKAKNIEESNKYLEQILKKDPKHVIALYLLAINYFSTHMSSLAVNTAIKALQVNPKLEFMRTIIAEHYASQENKYTIAIQLLKEEIHNYPNSTGAYRSLGASYANIGEIEESIEATKRQISITPQDTASYSNLLNFLHYKPGVTNEEILEAAKDLYNNCFSKLINNKLIYDHNRKRNDKLRLGFVSGDLKKHAVYYWVVDFLEALNKEVDIYCFCNNREDTCSEDLKSKVSHWHNIMKMSDEDTCNLIYENKIDILFDLSGHTDKNRLTVFLQKPAPVQVSWLGQSGPFGLPQIDYMLANKYLVKEGEEDHHTEKVYRLPNIYAPYGKLRANIEVSEAPCIKNGYVTFGSFNSFVKVNKTVISTWCEILKAVPNSKLMLKSHLFADPEMLKHYQEIFNQYGISSDRLTLEAFDRDREGYLQRYNEMDIALDSFPVGGGTTTNDLLLMSTPLIAIYGQRLSHRMSANILNIIGCPELIAKDREEYIKKAIELAFDKDRIQEYKKSIKEKFLNSLLTNNSQFTKEFLDFCKDITSHLS